MGRGISLFWPPRYLSLESSKTTLEIQSFFKGIGGEMLVVSQFTLYGDWPARTEAFFHRAEEPTLAKNLYEQFVSKLRGQAISVQTGEFQAKMEVHLINDGPVTPPTG